MDNGRTETKQKECKNGLLMSSSTNTWVCHEIKALKYPHNLLMLLLFYLYIISISIYFFYILFLYFLFQE